MTTRGRRSGLPREIEIWFTEYEGRFYIIAEYPDSHWLENIRSRDAVKVRVGETHFEGRARVISPTNEPELSSTIGQLSRAKYGWGEGTIVEISPEGKRGG